MTVPHPGIPRSRAGNLPYVTAEVRNPFDNGAAARRYASGRPYFHPVAVRAGAGLVPLARGRVGLALDVACGTGLSTRAVLEVADRVVAVDPSAAMLGAARRDPRVRYLRSAAEVLPLRAGCADLATVSNGFHWFDQARAFGELARVLRRGAALLVYVDFFRGRITGQPGFAAWLEESYMPRYPGPPRHAQFSDSLAADAGFGDPRYAEDDVHIPLSRDAMADYLMSQSSAGAAVESGAISEGALRAEILTEIAPFFPADGIADAVFGVRVWATTRR